MSATRSFDGTRLALTASGPKDAPVVVFVHGLGLSARSWGRVPELLASRHHVVLYDLRGHGRSERPASLDFSLAAHASDLRAVLDHVLRPGGRGVLVGNSFGGAVILAHAHQTSDAPIAGVVFAGSSGSAITLPGHPLPDALSWTEGSLQRAWLALLRGTARIGRHLGPVEAVSDRLVRRVAFTPRSSEDAVEQVREDFFATPAETIARTALASGTQDGTVFAPDLHAPALVLHGDRDPEIPRERVEELLAALPRGELVSFAGAGHMLALTHGDQVAAQIARWVARVRA